MNVGGSGIDVVGLYTLAVILNAAAVLWAAGVAMRLPDDAGWADHAVPGLLVLFFAPVYVPLSLLQGWIHGVAVVNPLTRVLESGRGFLAGTRPRSPQPSERLCCSRLVLVLGLRACARPKPGLTR